MRGFNPSLMTSQELYGLMIGSIIPRPIAWVSSMSAKGVGNLAPFSFFNGVGSEPPTLMFAISRKGDATKKDTLTNIEATGEFVVNIVSSDLLAPMHQTSADYPTGVDEMEAVGLQSLPSQIVKPRRVAGAKIHFECTLERVVDLADKHGAKPGTSAIVIGQIVWVHVDPSVMEGAYIDANRLQPVARLGGRNYTELGRIIPMPPAKI